MQKMYGSWQIVKKIDTQYVIAQCKCGKKSKKRLSLLERGRTKRCWDCYTKMRKVGGKVKIEDVHEGVNINFLLWMSIGVATLITVFLAYYACYMVYAFLD
jgi:hypothetical protein